MPLTYLELQAEQQKMVERLRVKSKTWLDANDITQQQLASTIRVSPSFLSDFLTGRRSLSNDTDMRLSAILEASPEFIKAQFPNRNPRIVSHQKLGQRVPDLNHINRSENTFDETHALHMPKFFHFGAFWGI